jgi:hypothetical protein
MFVFKYYKKRAGNVWEQFSVFTLCGHEVASGIQKMLRALAREIKNRSMYSRFSLRVTAFGWQVTVLSFSIFGYDFKRGRGNSDMGRCISAFA